MYFITLHYFEMAILTFQWMNPQCASRPGRPSCPERWCMWQGLPICSRTRTPRPSCCTLRRRLRIFPVIWKHIYSGDPKSGRVPNGLDFECHLKTFLKCPDFKWSVSNGKYKMTTIFVRFSNGPSAYHKPNRFIYKHNFSFYTSVKTTPILQR